jgi:hypothetical protein
MFMFMFMNMFIFMFFSILMLMLSPSVLYPMLRYQVQSFVMMTEPAPANVPESVRAGPMKTGWISDFQISALCNLVGRGVPGNRGNSCALP